MTRQTIKKPLTIIVLVAALTIIASGTYSFAISVTDPSQIDDFELIKQVAPKQDITQDELTNLRQIAITDDRVQKIISGKPYKFMGVNYVGNIYQTPVVWDKEIHINVNNSTQITAVIDQNNKVTKLQTMEIQKLTHERSFATDYLVTTDTVKGVQMSPTAASYSPISGNLFVAFLLNAQELNANDSFLCSAGHYADSYWAQVGYTNSPGSGSNIVYTDTGYGCIAQGTTVPYVNGASYKFRIYTEGSSWKLYGLKVSTGETFLVTRSGINYVTIQANDPDTNVFWENSNTNTTWDNQFSTNPQTTAHYQKAGSTTWWFWPGDAQIEVRNCVGSLPDTVISSDLVSGHTATWNRNTFADNYPAC